MSEQKTWRDRVQVHPAADLFPMLSDTKLDELGRGIKQNGLIHPIVLFCDQERPKKRQQKTRVAPVVLDGRNRLEAMERAGIELFPEENVGEDGSLFPDVFTIGFDKPVKILFRDDLEDADPYAYAVSANLHRRDLTAEQKRDLIAKLVKADPSRSDNATATLAKVSDKTVKAVRDKLEAIPRPV